MEPKRLITILGFFAPTLSPDSFAITEACVNWTNNTGVQKHWTKKKSRTRIQHGGSLCSYHHWTAVNNTDLRNTLHSIPTSTSYLATTKQILNLQKLRQCQSWFPVESFVSSPLPCTDQAAMPLISFQNIPFPYSDTLHSPTDCGIIMPDVQQGRNKQGRTRPHTPHSHHICPERNVHRRTVFTTPWIFMNSFQYIVFEVCPEPSASSVPSTHNYFPKVTIC